MMEVKNHLWEEFFNIHLDKLFDYFYTENCIYGKNDTLGKKEILSDKMFDSKPVKTVLHELLFYSIFYN